MRPRDFLPFVLSIACGFSSGAAVALPLDDGDDSASDSAAVPITYPHITKLETYILGETHVTDQLPARLARMEVKAFGAVSKDPDLSARTDALTDYADQKLGKKTPVAPDSNVTYSMDGVPIGDVQGISSGGSTAPDDDSGVVSNYPHITALENDILGQSYPQEALTARLSRMEAKAFGAPSTDPDLSNRTDALQNYAEKKLHRKPFDQQKAEQAAAEGRVSGGGGGAPSGGASGGKGGSKSAAVLNFLSSQLIGVPLPAVASALARAQGGSSSEQATPVEDPLVTSPTPPPAGTRMITQVGWCEVKVFGHTSPQLHLIERLEQLNAELSFSPGQKGSDLMDDVPKMILAAQERGGKQ